MKVFLENYNGILDTVRDVLTESEQLTDNPHQADVFLLWQDVRGVCRDLAILAKEQLGKPVMVMQHGRGATRDYCPPNNFGLTADKIMVWGEAEKQRLLRQGIQPDRIEVVGCPLFPRLDGATQERQGRNVLFVPVIAQKEEPENILVYAALKKWESEKLIDTVSTHFDKMKKAWAWEQNEMRPVKNADGTTENRLWRRNVSHTLPRWLTYGAGLVNVKLSGVHDQHQYQSPLIVSQQNDPHLIDQLAQLLQNVDAMVCLEEGTMQLMAAYLGIPVIVVDIFKYENYGGCANYDTVEKIKTKSSYWIGDIKKIGSVLDHALSHPRELDKFRRQVCEQEGGVNLGNPVQNILGVIQSCVKTPAAV